MLSVSIRGTYVLGCEQTQGLKSKTMSLLKYV